MEQVSTRLLRRVALSPALKGTSRTQSFVKLQVFRRSAGVSRAREKAKQEISLLLLHNQVGRNMFKHEQNLDTIPPPQDEYGISSVRLLCQLATKLRLYGKKNVVVRVGDF